MYVAVEYENDALNWLSKHAIECLIGLVIAFMVWEGRLLIELKNQQTINTVKLEHVNRAVNDVSDDDFTLREIVEQMRMDIAELRMHTRIRYGNESSIEDN